jgi:hypothetical protein
MLIVQNTVFFKLNIFIPLLDYFLVAIKDRFSEHVKKQQQSQLLFHNILLIRVMMI